MDNYIISTGDIIRVFEEYAINNQIYFVSETSPEGRHIAHTLNGKRLQSHPLDTIEYIRIHGRWWEVVSTNCSLETIDMYDDVTYDVVEVPHSIACELEQQYKELIA